MAQPFAMKIHKNLQYINKHLQLDATFLAIVQEQGAFTKNAVDEIQLEQTSGNKKSKFFMMLTRRGEKAFQAFILALVRTSQEHIALVVDETRAQELINKRDAEQNDADAEQTSSTESPFVKVSVTPVDLKDAKVIKVINDRKYVYPIRSGKRGRAVIINNEQFIRNPKMKNNFPDREGAMFDLVNLDQLLQSLHFHTVVHNNLKKQEILDVLVKEKCNPAHESADAFILCVLSHGEKGIVYGTDGLKVSIDGEICSLFAADNCPALGGKPKIFIIEASQGTQLTKGVRVLEDDEGEVSNQSPTEKDLSSEDTQDASPLCLNSRVYDKRDILVAYSTVEGYKSFGRPDFGSSFIRCIVDVFQERAHYEHLIDMLTKVRSDVQDIRTTEDNYIQLTRTDSGFTRNFYFLPGYNPQNS